MGAPSSELQAPTSAATKGGAPGSELRPTRRRSGSSELRRSADGTRSLELGARRLELGARTPSEASDGLSTPSRSRVTSDEGTLTARFSGLPARGGMLSQRSSPRCNSNSIALLFASIYRSSAAKLPLILLRKSFINSPLLQKMEAQSQPGSPVRSAASRHRAEPTAAEPGVCTDCTRGWRRTSTHAQRGCGVRRSAWQLSAAEETID